MKNMNKNLIFYGLGITLLILAILAVGGMLMPNKAHAEYAYYNFSSSNNNAPLYPTPKPQVIPVYQPIYQPIYQEQPVVYQNTYSNTPVANTNTTDVSNSDSSYYRSESSVKTSSTSDTSVTGNDYKNLTANSVFGKFSFMPSGLMQWILLGIFILVIVILVRKVTGKDEEYHATPLKHA